MYRVHSSEVIGKTLSAIHTYKWVTPEDEQRAWAELAEHGGWKGEIFTCAGMDSDDRQFHRECLVFRIWGGMVAVIRDITEQKHAEIEVRKRASELARANEDLLHFAYAASHDLRAPLRAGNQLLAVARADVHSEAGGRRDRDLSWIVGAGERMTTMLDGLLQFATLAGRATDFTDIVPLGRTVEAALENLRIAIEESGAVISCDPSHRT